MFQSMSINCQWCNHILWVIQIMAVHSPHEDFFSLIFFFHLREESGLLLSAPLCFFIVISVYG